MRWPTGRMMTPSSSRLGRRNGESIDPLTGHAGSVNSVCFSADGRLIGRSEDARSKFGLSETASDRHIDGRRQWRVGDLGPEGYFISSSKLMGHTLREFHLSESRYGRNSFPATTRPRQSPCGLRGQTRREVFCVTWRDSPCRPLPLCSSCPLRRAAPS
jgi:WD40 repeat protein